MAVELNLNGFDFNRAVYPITYKCQIVSEIKMDFVFPDNTAFALDFFKKQEDLEAVKKNLWFLQEQIGNKIFISWANFPKGRGGTNFM